MVLTMASTIGGDMFKLSLNTTLNALFTLVSVIALWASFHYNQLSADRLDSMRQIEIRLGELHKEALISNRQTMTALGFKQ